MHLRIATRKSELARWQANHAAKLIEALSDDISVELVPLSTRGDEILDRSLQKLGGKGLFIKELEVAMQQGEADIAVHSMKDVPAEMPEGFVIAALLTRDSPFDTLVSNNYQTLDQLPENATVGSSSLRRQAQLLSLRPDLQIKPLRGNVNTRLQKLDDGEFDAIVLAAAGLERLGMESRIASRFNPEQMLPAVAQGVIGIECLADNAPLRSLLAKLNNANSVVSTEAERGITETLQAGCHSPVGAFATLTDNSLKVEGMVASPDGSHIIKQELTGDPADAKQLGQQVADALLKQGGGKYIEERNP